MKNTTTSVIILVVLIFVIFGLLYGWFRKQKSIPSDVSNSIDNVGNRSSTQVTPETVDNFEKLWLDHVSLTRKFILEFLSNNPNVDNTEKELLQNQANIGNELDKYYPNSSKVITPILTEHIVQAKDIVTDLKLKRFNRLFSDIVKWYDNSDLFSDAMKKINSKWNLHSHMSEHLRITEREALYEWLGAKKQSLNIYNERIVPNASEMAIHIVDGL